MVTKQEVPQILRCKINKNYVFVSVKDSEPCPWLNSTSANHKFRCFKIYTVAIFAVLHRNDLQKTRKYVNGPF
jgi:hypothetical protein